MFVSDIETNGCGVVEEKGVCSRWGFFSVNRVMVHNIACRSALKPIDLQKELTSVNNSHQSYLKQRTIKPDFIPIKNTIKVRTIAI